MLKIYINEPLNNINRQEEMTKANILITIARVVAIIMMMVITILGTSPLQKSLSCPVSFKCHNFVWLEFLYPFYWWGKKSSADSVTRVG